MSDTIDRKKPRFVIKKHESGFVICKGCEQKLYRVLAKGTGTVIEIKCHRCKQVNRES
jgi:hypothetical protein